MPHAADRGLAIDGVLPHDVDEHEPPAGTVLLDDLSERRRLRDLGSEPDRPQELGALPRIHAARQVDLRDHPVAGRSPIGAQICQGRGEREEHALPGGRQLITGIPSPLLSGECAPISLDGLVIDDRGAHHAHGSTPAARSSAMRAAS